MVTISLADILAAAERGKPFTVSDLRAALANAPDSMRVMIYQHADSTLIEANVAEIVEVQSVTGKEDVFSIEWDSDRL